MEEKERYEYFFGTNTIKDNKTNQFYGCVVDLLNQQDKRIKELEQEKQQLKQQLHDLPNKIVEEIRDCVSKRIMEKEIKWGDNIQIGFICNAINECLDAILEKYGDKNHKEIKELKKALELACDYLVSNGNEDDELYKLVQNIYDDDEYLATKINYFKSKAKEMLENE